MKRSAQTVKRQMRSMATSLALVATLGAMYRRSDIMEGLASWVTGLVFPSGDITLSKLLWLAVGLTLACVHLQDFVCNTIAIVHLWQTSSLRHQLFLVDEYSRRTNAIALLTDKQQRLEVETQQFQGQVAIATTGESIGVQVQGRFTRPVPVNSKLFVALELPVEARDVGVGMRVLLALFRLLRRCNDVHISSGENKTSDADDLELPHFAVAMRSDNHVELSLRGPHHMRKSLPPDPGRLDKICAEGKIYSFHSTVRDWKWRWLARLVLTVVSWFSFGWVNSHPVHFTAYLVAPPFKNAKLLNKGRRHTTAYKRHIFCFSVHRQEKSLPSSDPRGLRIILPHDLYLDELDAGSPISLWNSKNQRRGGVPLAHAEACRRIAEDARALSRLAFSLDVWVEFVDRVAGRRKVGYLFDVVDTVQQRQRTVLRSATTLKNTVLLLRLEHQLDRKENQNERDLLEGEELVETDNEAVDFQHLVVESREYRYEQIEHEASAVARTLNQVAAKPSQGRRRWWQPQSCYQHQLEKAALFRCLSGPSHLPSVSSHKMMGVQISEAQHAAMDVVHETGIYRLHGAGDGTIQLLRQEWFIVTASQLQFFRSYSVAPALNVPITHVLNICSIDNVRLLNDAGTRQDKGEISRWYCVEIHLALEIITLFVETSEARDQLVASLKPLTNDECDLKVMSPAAKVVGCEAVATAPLFTPMILNSQTHPVCLNQRSSRFISDYRTDACSALDLVQETAESGLEVFSLGDVAARCRINRAAVLRFLDKVELLNGLDLDVTAAQISHEHRFALALNLYHTLFIHATLVFGYPQSHEQWKLIQIVPCYLVRTKERNCVRFTLSDIQHVMLRCPVPVSLEASGIKRSLSQNALMDLAIGGGDAINGLCRTVLGVTWTPILPNSSSYAAVKNTPLPIPAHLSIDHADFRSSLVLQINSSPPHPKTTGIMCVYDGGRDLDEQLTATCTAFLRRELRLDETSRVIYLPRVCEWYHISHREDKASDHNDAVNRRMGPLTQRRRRSSSGSVSGVAALSTSRSFFCLQRLLGFMDVEQHHRAMHLLLGAGEECRFVFDEFWTRPSRSAAANLLSSAGVAALEAFTGSSSKKFTGVKTRKSLGSGAGCIDDGKRGLRSYF